MGGHWAEQTRQEWECCSLTGRPKGGERMWEWYGQGGGWEMGTRVGNREKSSRLLPSFSAYCNLQLLRHRHEGVGR